MVTNYEGRRNILRQAKGMHFAYDALEEEYGPTMIEELLNEMEMDCNFEVGL